MERGTPGASSLYMRPATEMGCSPLKSWILIKGQASPPGGGALPLPTPPDFTLHHGGRVRARENLTARSEGTRQARSSWAAQSPACPLPSVGDHGGQGVRGSLPPVLCAHLGTSSLTLRGFPVKHVR